MSTRIHEKHAGHQIWRFLKRLAYKTAERGTGRLYRISLRTEEGLNTQISGE